MNRFLPVIQWLEYEATGDISSCRIHSSGDEALERAKRLLRAATLPNEGKLIVKEEGWRGVGDTVDLALLAVASLLFFTMELEKLFNKRKIKIT